MTSILRTRCATPFRICTLPTGYLAVQRYNPHTGQIERWTHTTRRRKRAEAHLAAANAMLAHAAREEA
jgi:hypothetical protein